MANITLLGASYQDVPAVTLPKTGGGTATFYELANSYLPPSATLVASAEQTLNFSADTSFDSWTPSAANTSILAAGATRGACSYTITSSEYQDAALIGMCMYHTTYAYNATMVKGYSVNKTIIGMAEYAPIKITSYNNDYYGAVDYGAQGRAAYYSSNTAISVYASTAYGVSPTGITWSTSSTTSTTRTVGFTRPIVYARCSTNQFSTTAANNIDSANSNILCKYQIYKIDKTESTLYRVFDANNGVFFT